MSALRGAADRPPFPMAVRSLRFLGHGIAYDIQSDELGALRTSLAERWRDRLSRQDRQGFRPHITIQNKVEAPEAKSLHEVLSASFRPFEIEAAGLLLWRYRGGPWEAAGRFPFWHEEERLSIDRECSERAPRR